MNMANTKTGLNYYTIDTDRYMDRRIKRLKKDLGCRGLAVYDYILCEIYRVHGCFTEWDEDTAFDVAEYLGLKESNVSEIVQYCGVVGLFDKELLSRGIVTSESIQRRYLEMCSRAKRKDACIPEECRIIREECEIIREECPITPEVCIQSKVKYSKVNNTLSISPSSQQANESMSAELTAEEKERIYEIFYFEKNSKNYGREAERFINHYSANGWMRANSTLPIKNKVALARNWKCEFTDKRVPDEFLKWLYAVYKKVKSTNHDGAMAILRGIDNVKPFMCPNLHIDLYLRKYALEMINSAKIAPTTFTLNFKVKKE